jgi:glutamate synthase (NADPH/NADH)
MFHSAIMEPWDGPALISFTDGRYIGATLDRNGLRPGRYYVTKGGRVIMASEVGVVDVADDEVIKKGRLMPGNIFLVDFDEHRIIEDKEMKQRYADKHPYGQWVKQHAVTMETVMASVPEPSRRVPPVITTVPVSSNGNGSNGSHKPPASSDEALAAILQPLKTFG